MKCHENKESTDSKKKNRNSALKFDRQTFSPYDLYPWCYSNECMSKGLADEIKITNWLTLNWRDYPGGPNIITQAFKRRREESL